MNQSRKYSIVCSKRPELNTSFEGSLEAAHSIAHSIARLAYYKNRDDSGKSGPVVTGIITTCEQKVIATIIYKGHPWE